MSGEEVPTNRSASRSEDRGLVRRQLAGTLRLDLRRALLSPRSLAMYVLAFAPLVLVAIWSLSPFPLRELDGPQEAMLVFGVLFELYVRVSIFFSTLFLFVSLYRSEILERSLHYYLLTPVRREVLALGKYLAALIATTGVFLVGTVGLFLLVLLPWGPGAMANYLFAGPGLANLLGYAGVVALACAGYGALFLLAGVLFRNPVLPAAAIWIWEAIVPLLPPLLKRASVVFYLHSLYPIPPARGLLEVIADPAPAWVSVPSALAFIVLVLVVVAWRVRRMDLAYGGE